MSKARHYIFHIMLEYVTQAAMLGVKKKPQKGQKAQLFKWLLEDDSKRESATVSYTE